MAHDQEVVGLNSGTVYWMDVSNNASFYKKLKYKGAHQKLLKNYIFKKPHFNYRMEKDCTLIINMSTVYSPNVSFFLSFFHAFGARGPGFDPIPKPRMAFCGSSHLPPFRQQT
jgi:hypothetical protein